MVRLLTEYLSDALLKYHLEYPCPTAPSVTAMPQGLHLLTITFTKMNATKYQSERQTMSISVWFGPTYEISHRREKYFSWS